jgi:hypothetical protein
MPITARRRLIPAPRRRLSGHRAYPIETVERIPLWDFLYGRSANSLAFQPFGERRRLAQGDRWAGCQ